MRSVRAAIGTAILVAAVLEAQAACDAAGANGWTAAWMQMSGCDIRSRVDAHCLDTNGVNNRGSAYMDIQHSVTGNYGVWASDFVSGSGHELQSCIDSTGYPNHCYSGNAYVYIADIDSPTVYYDQSMGLGGECCGAIWPQARIKPTN